MSTVSTNQNNSHSPDTTHETTYGVFYHLTWFTCYCALVPTGGG